MSKGIEYENSYCVWERVSDLAQAGPSLQEDSKAKGWRIGDLTFCPERSERLHGNEPKQGGDCF